MRDFEIQNLWEYLAIAISSDTESIISDKQSANFILSPFEEVFISCWIDLSEREDIARDLIENIHAGAYSDVSDMRYSDIRFGDCIIPFPDSRRGWSLIPDSFDSNKLTARTLAWNPLSFWSLENSAELFSLWGLNIDGSYQWVQDSNLLDLQSIRLTQDSSFPKEQGSGKLLYIHQNHYINIFSGSHIRWNNSTGYTVAWDSFDANHIDFIRASDSEQERTLSAWREIRDGIYSKTLIQEDTFEELSGVYIPKQHVGVTTYYAILYNYDTTQPECPFTLYSQDSSGQESFIFPESPWFNTAAYGQFVCEDIESGCDCDSSTENCYMRDNSILSIPQKIPHNDIFRYRFWNHVSLNRDCESPTDTTIFYDTSSPDVSMSLPGIDANDLEREYVDNAGILYNGIQVSGKNFYNISNNLSFQADENISMQLTLIDSYVSWDANQGVSGLQDYEIIISKYENNNWLFQIGQQESFDEYNASGTLTSSDTHVIDVAAIDWSRDIFTQIWDYQVKIYTSDQAGNQSRIIFHFTIIPGDIDESNSFLIASEANTIFADNSQYYDYSLSLRDEYMNPIAAVDVGDIEHTCSWVADCSLLRTNMSWNTPSWNQALEVLNSDTISDDNWVINFSLRSKVPGLFTESFSFEIWNPVISYDFIGLENSFLAPYIGILESQISWNWLADTLPVNQPSNFRVRIEDPQGLWNWWTLSDFSEKFAGRHTDTGFTWDGSINVQSDGVYFSGTFTSTLAPEEQHKTLLEIIDSGRSGIIISYDIGWEEVQYRLSPSSTQEQVLSLGNTGELDNPVRIIGKLQWVWNIHNANERQNITNVDTYKFRNTLRKNVWTSIKSRVHDSVVNGVKYIDKTNDFNKTYTLESNPNFETLIVRNWNIHISNDFNNSNVDWDMVWIISYIDGWYNQETGFDDVGNIYIEPEVTTINAVMYADGGVISTNSGNPVSWNVDDRNNLLIHQLTIVWSIFSRNTLAGAREESGNYMLPGSEMTSDQVLATQYDLYYLRRGNEWCSQDGDGFCDIPQYLIVEYDPRITSDPPPFFQSQ